MSAFLDNFVIFWLAVVKAILRLAEFYETPFFTAENNCFFVGTATGTTSHSTSSHPVKRARRWYSVVTLLYDLWLNPKIHWLRQFAITSRDFHWQFCVHFQAPLPKLKNSLAQDRTANKKLSPKLACTPASRCRLLCQCNFHWWHQIVKVPNMYIVLVL